MSADAPINAFTVDVEDWFHILELEGAPGLSDWDRLEPRVSDNVDRLLGLTRELGVRGTWFLLGWVVEHHPETAQRIAAAGHEIATHGYAHELVSEIGPGRFRADIDRAIGIIEKVVGVRPVGYRAPGFSISEDMVWALEILAEAGLKFDSSIFPAKRAHGSSPGARTLPHELELPDGNRLQEFPISVTSIAGRRIGYCGGGYLRLFPYWFIASRIRAANARGEPVVVYIHPRDIDPDQPRLEMSASRRFRSYVNLDSAYGKLRRLFSEFRFGSVSEALERAA